MFDALRRIPRAEAAAVGVSVVVGILLLSIKFAAYYLTGSTAIFSDAVESIVNVLAALVALWALAVAHTPPDESHPYGHGKVEFVSAGFEGGMILLAAVFVFVSTVDTVFFHDLEPQRVDLGLWLTVLAMVINGIVGGMLVRVGRRRSSLTLEAGGYHLLSDAITSVAVLVGLGIVQTTGWVWADPIVAVAIAVYIAIAGLKLVRRSFGGLMDAQDAADERALLDLLNSHIGAAGKSPQICSFHKLRHRHSGRYHWVDFHIMVPADLNVKEGHRIASEIEHEMEVLLGEGNATAHVEPCDADDCSHCRAHARQQKVSVKPS